MMINKEIDRLIAFALDKQMISKWDIHVTRNEILDILDLDSYEESGYTYETLDNSVEILENILNWAVENKKIEDGIVFKDILDSKIMAALMPKQSEVIREFYENYEKSPKEATDRYYDLSKYSNYIRTERVSKDIKWSTETEYGELELTINLSKPEKDPKTIAAEKHATSTNYPKCLLCVENAGYRGRINHPARKNHRIVPVTLGKDNWYIQYSPYVYYNEHAIIFSEKHEPMKISKEGIGKLLEFTDKFPHYFVGSNADLPIVGGSILNHDHFQGGNYSFPMEKAPMEFEFKLEKFPEIEAGIVKWPMSVIRLAHLDKNELLEATNYILETWKNYSDESADILAFTGDTPHNTITPIVRRRGEKFEIDIVLRNNLTTVEHPMGLYHPHEELHNIKKENIGLIEVMGLAILPGRLKDEIAILADYLQEDNSLSLIQKDERVNKHYNWIKEIQNTLGKDIETSLKAEIGKVFEKVLHCAGVYKRTEKGQGDFKRFIYSL